MIVCKFGGTSVADAERIRAIGSIVAGCRDQSPVVVVSALAGITDLIEGAVDAAGRDDRESLERCLAELERRHRWAVSGAVEDAAARHDLSLAVDAAFEELRQLLRSVRVLGEITPRARDTLLAFGELLSSRIVVAAFRERGLPADWVDPREVVRTDDRHGCAEADLDAVAERCRATLAGRLEAGRIPVVGGFVGSAPDGATTTLGRGGSDTSAAAIGAACGAREIRIWTDVDGLMSADPKLVPAARTLPRVSFAEAAELASCGARVLHPPALVPAVRRGIPVRVLNSLAPAGPGTVVLGEPGPDAPPLAAVASRGGRQIVRIRGRRPPIEPGAPCRVLRILEDAGRRPELLLTSELALTAVLPRERDAGGLAGVLGPEFGVDVSGDKGLLAVIGGGLDTDGACRRRVLAALAALEPELVAAGATGTGLAAVVPDARLAEAVRAIHREFFEGSGS